MRELSHRYQHGYRGQDANRNIPEEDAMDPQLRRTAPAWTSEDELDLLTADEEQQDAEDAREVEYEYWCQRREWEQQEEARVLRALQHDQHCRPPNASHAVPPAHHHHRGRTGAVTAAPRAPSRVIDLDPDTDADQILQAVREWEAVHGPMEHHGTADAQLDAVSLMQAVNPTHSTIQALQDNLETMALLRQATRAKMLTHRLAAWQGGGRLPDAATSLQALLTVYVGNVPPHKMMPTDDDHSWVRHWWQQLETALGPAPPQESTVMEVDSQASAGGPINFTGLPYQEEHERLQRAAALARQEEAAELAKCMENTVGAAPDAGNGGPSMPPPALEARPKQYTLEIRHAQIVGNCPQQGRTTIQAGGTFSLRLELALCEDPAEEVEGTKAANEAREQYQARQSHDAAGSGEGRSHSPPDPPRTKHAARQAETHKHRATEAEAGGAPRPAVQATVGATQLYEEEAQASPATNTPPGLPVTQPDRWAYSALPPTPPKNRYQRNLHEVGGMHPSPRCAKRKLDSATTEIDEGTCERDPGQQGREDEMVSGVPAHRGSERRDEHEPRAAQQAVHDRPLLHPVRSAHGGSERQDELEPGAAQHAVHDCPMLPK